MSSPSNPLSDAPAPAPSMWSNLATYLPVVAAHVAAAVGNYHPLDMLNQQQAQLMHWQEMRNQHDLLNSQLQSADLQRQRTQQELDNFQTPAQAQAMQLDTAGKVAALHNQYEKPDQFVGVDDQQRPAYFQRKFNADTREWDTSPVTTSRETTISSPESPKIPFDPSQVITRSTRSQLLAPSPKQPNVSTKEDLQNQYVVAMQRGDAAQAAKLQGLLKGIDPLGGEKIGLTIRGQNLAQDRADNTASRQDIREHDKAYVQPAELVERSYQLFREAQQAFDSGDVKTGAASMLALSQHLGTTFGQIKSSRMNKDLIAEHRDAIGVEDKIDRFLSSLSTGQQLSPDQFREFGDQINNMRRLTWQMAVKEGQRKNVPIDFLPSDLQGAGSNGAPPPGANVIKLDDFLKQ